MSKPEPSKPPLLTLRSAVVLLFALLVAGAAGGLAYVSTRNTAGALIVSGTAFAGAVVWFDNIVA